MIDATDCSEVLINNGSELVKASVLGSDAYSVLYNKNLMVHCLCGYVNSVDYRDSKYYLGNTEISTSDINAVKSKIFGFSATTSVDYSLLPVGEV